jgi:hypothetical protein
MKAQQIEDTDVNKNVQPHWKLPGAKRSQPGGPKKVVCIALAVGKQVGTPLLLSLFVFFVRPARANIQGLHTAA